MKTKLINVYNAFKALNAIKQNNDMHFALCWQFDDMLKECKEHVKRYEEEQKKLLDKYGVCIDEGKGHYNIEKNHIEKYQEEINKLDNYEIELNVKMINKADLKNLIVPKHTAINFLSDFITD